MRAARQSVSEPRAVATGSRSPAGFLKVPPDSGLATLPHVHPRVIHESQNRRPDPGFSLLSPGFNANNGQASILVSFVIVTFPISLIALFHLKSKQPEDSQRANQLRSELARISLSRFI